jgi:hypothetical protein
MRLTSRSVDFGEGDGGGRNSATGSSQLGLETDRVDLGSTSGVHRGDVVSNQVVSKISDVISVVHSVRGIRKKIRAYPDLRPEGMVKLVLPLSLPPAAMASVGHAPL